MQTLSAGNAAHVQQSVTTLAVCWRIERADGILILGTEHDRDLEVTAVGYAGTYQASAGITGSAVSSTSDMSVDNMEVQGAVTGTFSVIDLSPTDIEAGLFDAAKVTLFMINWEDPTQEPIVARCGTLGEIRRNAEGMYYAELRGLAQALTQIIVRTYGATCDAELGDARCGVSLGAITVTGTVTVVASNREFTVTMDDSSDPGTLDGGLLTWSAGENSTYTIEIKKFDSGTGVLTLYLPMFLDVEIGDTFSARPGCDKSAAMCKGQYNNLVNYRGHGAWVPGVGELTVFGGQTPQRRETRVDFFTYPRP